jgi:hypothetical protein
MKYKGAGRGLIAAGVVCLLIYVLISLYGLSATGLRVGTLLLYAGVIMVIVGIVVRLSRKRA